MNCQEAQPFVSALNDGETVPKEAARHIRECARCRQRLHDYAEMGAELRLVAGTEPEGTLAPPPVLPSRRRYWTRRLSGRVLVPRFAIGLALITITGLSMGLTMVHNQGPGPWFQFEVSSSAGNGMIGKVGGVLQAGEPATGGFLPAWGGKKIAVLVRAVEVRNDRVRLQIQDRIFVPQAGGHRSAIQALANTHPQMFHYVPGQKLVIPLNGGGSVELTGKVYRVRPTLWEIEQPLMPKSDEMAIANPALVEDNNLLGKVGGSASARGGNPAVAVCVPPEGAFVFALKPFAGAAEAVAEYGQARFKMDGHHYTVYSALPMTGGPQPRKIWVYKAPHCPYSSSVPHMIGTVNVSRLGEWTAPSPTQRSK